jgi:translation initiation factor 5A
MDLETFETFETTAIEEEIKDRIAQGEVQGRDVEYWKVLDRIKIVRIKA